MIRLDLIAISPDLPYNCPTAQNHASPRLEVDGMTPALSLIGGSMMKSKHGRRHASGGERNAQYKEELCEILRRIVDKGLAEIEGTMREIERLEVERRQLVLLLEIARLSSGSRPACEFGTN